MSTTLNLKTGFEGGGGDMQSKITMETHATHARARYTGPRYPHTRAAGARSELDSRSGRDTLRFKQ